MLPPLISVVIPNWNGRRFLPPCLEALRRQTWTRREVLVVDNGSSDGSLEMLRRAYPEVRLLRFPTNRGFSAAVNAGIAAARGDCIALLNNDTEAEPRWLEALHGALGVDPALGFAASQMRCFRQRHLLDGAGDAYTRYGLAFPRGHLRPARGRYDRPDEPFSACAGAALYRRALFEQSGLFDEDFFCYLEDVDLCFRGRWRGFRGVYVPDAIVYHHGAGSSGRRFTPFQIRHDVRNMLNVMTKNLPREVLLPGLGRIFLYQLKVAAVYVVLRHAPLAYARGLLGFFHQLPRMLAKRRRIMSGRRVPTSAILTHLLASEHERRRSRRL